VEVIERRRKEALSGVRVADSTANEKRSEDSGRVGDRSPKRRVGAQRRGERIGQGLVRGLLDPLHGNVAVYSREAVEKASFARRTAEGASPHER